MTFTHLDLFAGIGGFSRAVHWLGGTTVGFVEWDSWNRRVLAKHWPEAQFHGDIGTLTADTLRSWGIRTTGCLTGVTDAREARRQQSEREEHDGRSGAEGGARNLDLLTGGYPCQPFSHAGKRLGAEDDRHLWPEMRRVLNLTRPRFVLAENVAGHVTMGLDTVLAELEADGYACGAVVVPACAVNALHRRDRVWILASTVGVPDADGRHGDGRPEPDHGRSDGTQVRNRAIATIGMADAAARGLRRGRAPGHDGQPALGGEGISNSNSGRCQPSQCHGSGTGRSRATSDAAPHDAEGTEAPRSLDAGPDGVSAGLVRRPAARSPWGDPDVIRAMWADGSWEADLPRVVAEEAERRQKLQAAGNAIVPIVAYEILRVMLGSEADRV